MARNIRRDDDDEDETMSIKSSMSSDDEDFVVMGLQNLTEAQEMPAFQRKGSFSETGSLTDASDTKDPESSSLNTLSSDRPRDLVSSSYTSKREG